MRRLKLGPIDASLVFIGFQAPQRIVEVAVVRIARITLRHDDKIWIEFVAHVHGSAVARNRLLDWNDGHPGALGPPFALDRLVIDANAGNARTHGLSNHTADRHNTAMARVAIHDD